MSDAKSKSGKQESESGGLVLVDRRGLAAVLCVSVHTVDRMVAAREIVPLRIRGLVRFYVPDVVRTLSANEVTRKHGRRADVEKLHSTGGAR